MAAVYPRRERIAFKPECMRRLNSLYKFGEGLIIPFDKKPKCQGGSVCLSVNVRGDVKLYGAWFTVYTVISTLPPAAKQLYKL